MCRIGDGAGGGLELFNAEIGGDQHQISLDPHSHPIAQLDRGDMFALLVDQEIHDANRGFQQHFLAAPAHAFFLKLAQNGQCYIVIGPQQAGAMAMRTRLRRRLEHAGAQPLARHFQQAKATDPTHLNPGPVGFQPVLEALFDRSVILAFVHVDVIDDNQPGQIAQAQLAGNLVGGFKVGFQSGLFDRPFFGRPARVHVDGHQRLGHADDDIAAGRQLHRWVEHARQVPLDLKPGEQWHLFGVQFHVFGMRRHDHFHEVLGDAVARFALDQHFVDVLGIQIADRAFDQVALFIDLGGRNRPQGQFADLFPQALQVFVITLDFRLGALRSGGADDQTGAIRHLDLVGDFLELLAVHRIGDLAADPAATRGIGHQHAVAPGQ